MKNPVSVKVSRNRPEDLFDPMFDLGNKKKAFHISVKAFVYSSSPFLGSNKDPLIKQVRCSNQLKAKRVYIIF